MLRGNGILLSISSLPGKQGIGALGSYARKFIDQLTASSQKYWQILPLSPTGFGDSPYQSFSAFAGNPYFIDVEELFIDGLLTQSDLDEFTAFFYGSENCVDYNMQYENKEKILRKAFRNAGENLANVLADFKQANAFWLNDYALFMAIKSSQGMKPFTEWPKELANRDEKALLASSQQLTEETEYHAFVQYLFFQQWYALKQYAVVNGISIIGDMPIYISEDSADAWAHPHILSTSGDMAGCPPDYFARSGQLWGNPVYNWDALKQSGYDWWAARMTQAMKMYDYIRLDHFRGFEAFYSIPCCATTAETGSWCKGPGIDLFNALKQKLGELPIIAEDLGFLTPEVAQLLEQTGFPGLKVLQFAFDPDGQSEYLPHRYERHCVVYTGTHDNDTTVGWYQSLDPAQKEFLNDYAYNVDAGNVHWKLIRLAMASVADVCIIPMQDLLGLSSQARMNTPQTLGDNWKWRLKESEFHSDLIKKLKRLTLVYGRL